MNNIKEFLARFWQHVIAHDASTLDAANTYTDNKENSILEITNDLQSQINEKAANKIATDTTPGIVKASTEVLVSSDGTMQLNGILIQQGTGNNAEIFNLAAEASGGSSHAEGVDTKATNWAAHAEGGKTTASGQYSHAEGNESKALGTMTHAEGYDTTALGSQSHAEGYHTTANGTASHAEGLDTHAEGVHSHVEGRSTVANGGESHAEGYYTIASSNHQHVQGQYNIEDAEGKYAHIVGNGTDDDARCNAHTLDWNGNAWFAGDIYIGGTGQDDAIKLEGLPAVNVDNNGQILKVEDGAWTIIPGITTDDVIDILTEAGAITPLADEDGSVYTDENENLYIL